MNARGERRLAILIVLVGMLLLFVALSAYLVEQRMTRTVQYFLLAGVVLLVAYAILDPTAVLQLVRSRQARFGSLSVVVTALVIGILGLVNVAASKSTAALDLTHAKLNTLAPQSVLAAKRLDAQLTVIGLYRSDQRDQQKDAAELLSLYHAENTRLMTTFGDYDQHLDAVQTYRVSIPGSLVFVYKDRQPIVLNPGSQTEENITSTLLKLESNKTPTVCWAVGDGERDLKDSSGAIGFSDAEQLITSSNFKAEPLTLTQAATIPTTCDLLALVGPQRPLNDNASRLLSTYLDNGGPMLVAVDRWKDPASVNAILKPFGASFTGGSVNDPDPQHHNAGDSSIVFVFSYGQSPITKDLANVVTAYPQPTAISSGQTDAATVEVAKTTNSAYEAPVQRADTNTRQNDDHPGPFTIMATVERAGGGGKKKTRLVLVGTPSFAENAVIEQVPGNRALLINSMQWLSEQESLISIPPKPTRSQPLNLSEFDKNLNIFLTVVLMPMVAAAGGVAVWWSRRAAA